MMRTRKTTPKAKQQPIKPPSIIDTIENAVCAEMGTKDKGEAMGRFFAKYSIKERRDFLIRATGARSYSEVEARLLREALGKQKKQIGCRPRNKY